MNGGTYNILTWWTALLLMNSGLNAENGGSWTKCLGPDYLATCAIGDGRDGVETVTGRALPEEARDGVYHIKDIKFTVSNTSCFNYTAGCSYGGPTPATASSVGCFVDDMGTWEKCRVEYCSDLPFCDPKLRALAEDATMDRKVQVYTAQQFANAIINDVVEEIVLMERIYVTDAELPPVPIPIKRYVEIKKAEESLYLILNTTLWDQFLVSKTGLWICTFCSMVIYAKEWGASLQIPHPYTPAPQLTFERGGVARLDDMVLITDCFAMDPAGVMLVPYVAAYGEPFTRGASEDVMTSLSAPIEPDPEEELDRPEGLLRYWILPDVYVNIGDGVLQARRPRLVCIAWVDMKLWGESYRTSLPPPMADAQILPDDPMLVNASKSDGSELHVWLGVAGAAIAILGAGCASLAWRMRKKSAAPPEDVEPSWLAAQARHQQMLDVLLMAVSHTSSIDVEPPQSDQSSLELQWSMLNERLNRSQNGIREEDELGLTEESRYTSTSAGSRLRSSVNSKADGAADCAASVDASTAGDRSYATALSRLSGSIPGVEEGAADREGAPANALTDSDKATVEEFGNDSHSAPAVTPASHPPEFALAVMSMMDVEDLVIDSGTNQYRVHEMVGSGAFSLCYRAMDARTNCSFVMKIAKFSRYTNDFKLEAELLGMLHHPHVARLRESFSYRNREVLVMDWYAGGDLRKLVNREVSSIDEDFVWSVAAQLTLATAHIHANKVVHRDIKLENVFLTEDGDIKIGDFGTARVILDEATTFAGTPQCMAPEVIQHKPYTQKSDVWSMGTMIYELVTRMPLVEGRSIESVKEKHSSLEPEKTLIGPDGGKVNVDLARMILSMLTTDPIKRPTPQNIIDEPYMQRAIQRLIAKRTDAMVRNKDIRRHSNHSLPVERDK